MDKEFVPYEQALALKELEFNEPCFGYYLDKKFNIFHNTPLNDRINSKTKDIFSSDVITAPTFSKVFRWFREKYNLHQVILVDEKGKYDIIVGKRISGSCLGQYKTYKEAEQECLKKLIEIVKNQIK